MEKQSSRWKKIRLIIYFIVIVCFILFVKKGISTLKNVTKIYVVEKGNLKLEEKVEGYVLRDEKILKGENFKNGMIQMIAEGERVSKGGKVFRYYSQNEGETLEKIESLDSEINKILEKSEIPIVSNDISILEKNIKQLIESMYKMNEIDGINDKISELNSYISKKAKITGLLSPADSEIRKLVDERAKLEESLTTSSETVYAPISGLVSYKIDGYEENLRSK